MELCDYFLPDLCKIVIMAYFKSHEETLEETHVLSADTIIVRLYKKLIGN